MAIVDIGMTMEEVLAAGEPISPGTKRFGLEKFLVNELDGSVFFTTKAGGKMVKALVRCIDPDPAQHGKSHIYQATIGAFTFANLCKALPGLMTNSGLDTEGMLGAEFMAEVSIQYSVKNDDGSYTRFKTEVEAEMSGKEIFKSNNLSKMRSA